MVAARGAEVPELKAIVPIAAISRWYGYAYGNGVRYFLNSQEPTDEGFDTPLAFAALHELRGEVNRTRDAKLAGLLKALGGTVGLFQADPETFLKGAVVDIDVDAKVAERNAAKKAKNFALADAIRKELEAAGIVLEDKPGGVTEWRRK